jgi:endoglycosylceramidase
MRDAHGRAVMLRGANLDVGLRRPTAGGDLSTAALDGHAQAMRRLGFNVVRLQLTWGAIEPGNKGPNDPAICAPGPPGDPGQWDEAHARRYLERVDRVVRVLERHGISTLFQIAQYAYNESFGGPPSHPAWAVCTNGVPITRGPGPSAYSQPGVSIAAEHFWQNDVRGNLQGEYERMLAALARRFAGRRSVAGYEVYNEPFESFGALPDGRFDGLVQCFYGGSRDPGRLADGSRPDCPPGVPAVGAIPRMREVDPGHLIHPQAHIFTNFGVETRMGPLPARDLVFNFHVYCASGLGVQTVPDQVRGPECDTTEERAVEESERTRRAMASSRQPGALPSFLSEFGYGDNEAMLRHMTTLADRHLLGWAYFTWRNQDGPDNEGIVRNADGSLRPKARLLGRPYPAAVNGTPTSMSYEPEARRFELAFRPRPGRDNPATIVALPNIAYGRDGACPTVSGAEWRLAGDGLVVRAHRGVDSVRVRVRPGRCGRSSLERRVCLNSRRGVSGKRLGPALLGRDRRRQRRAFRGKRLRTRAGIDRYCATGGGSFRIAYPTARLRRAVGRSLSSRIRGRAVLILSSSRRIRVRGLRRGDRVAVLRRRVRRLRAVRVGRNVWYLAPARSARLVFKTRRRRILAVGIADARLARAPRRLLGAWRL